MLGGNGLMSSLSQSDARCYFCCALVSEFSDLSTNFSWRSAVKYVRVPGLFSGSLYKQLICARLIRTLRQVPTS